MVSGSWLKPITRVLPPCWALATGTSVPIDSASASPRVAKRLTTTFLLVAEWVQLQGMTEQPSANPRANGEPGTGELPVNRPPFLKKDSDPAAWAVAGAF